MAQPPKINSQLKVNEKNQAILLPVNLYWKENCIDVLLIKMFRKQTGYVDL
jgi:hypothetical protein